MNFDKNGRLFYYRSAINLNRKKSKADDEIGDPVDGYGDSGCHRTSRRIKQFRNEEPRNGARTGSEEHDVDNNQDDAEVCQPCRHILLITNPAAH